MPYLKTRADTVPAIAYKDSCSLSRQIQTFKTVAVSDSLQTVKATEDSFRLSSRLNTVADSQDNSRQLQNIADMSVLVSSVRWSLSNPKCHGLPFRQRLW